MAQLPVGRSRSLARACGQQALVLCMQQQAYVAYVVFYVVYVVYVARRPLSEHLYR